MGIFPLILKTKIKIRISKDPRQTQRENESHIFFALLIFKEETGKFAHFPILLLDECQCLSEHARAGNSPISFTSHLALFLSIADE